MQADKVCKPSPLAEELPTVGRRCGRENQFSSKVVNYAPVAIPVLVRVSSAVKKLQDHNFYKGKHFIVAGLQAEVWSVLAVPGSMVMGRPAVTVVAGTILL